MNTHETLVTVRLIDAGGHLTEPRTIPKVVKSDDAWRTRLTEEQFRITRTHGTERAFCGIFYDNHQRGVYACIGCGLPLFRSDAKFDSGTGWPSFLQPVADENIGNTRDGSSGKVRTEIHCARCDSHLGHVFDDGPAPTRLRYCINSDALAFFDDDAKPAGQKVLLGAGCFWGIEQAFRQVRGVNNTRVGFAGGHTKNPGYEDVCSHTTGHAEVVEVEFDPGAITFEALLEVFWQNHHPTQPHRPDDQYRSAIFFTTPVQETIARESSLEEARQLGAIAGGPPPLLGTEIAFAPFFYPAEEYHQRYYEKHASRSCRIP